MSAEISQLMVDESSVYLEQLQDLISEMNTGMNAIATNSVGTLKESVAKQELLCANLAALRVADDRRLTKLTQSRPLDEIDVEMTIWDASNTIRQLTLQYAALLKHSGRTVTLLSSLCNTHSENSNESNGPWSKQQTWSCEI